MSVNIQRGITTHGKCGQYSEYWVIGDLCYVYFRENLQGSSNSWQLLENWSIPNIKTAKGTVGLVCENAAYANDSVAKVMMVNIDGNANVQYIAPKTQQYVGYIIFPIYHAT